MKNDKQQTKEDCIVNTVKETERLAAMGFRQYIRGKTTGVLRSKLEELLAEQKSRKGRDDEFTWDGVLSVYSPNEERWYCDPELFSLELLNQTILEIKEEIAERQNKG